MKEKQHDLEHKRKEVEEKMDRLLKGLPNIPADDVPVGMDESENKEVS